MLCNEYYDIFLIPILFRWPTTSSSDKVIWTLYPSNPKFSMTAIYLIIKSFLEIHSYGEHRKLAACIRLCWCAIFNTISFFIFAFALNIYIYWVPLLYIQTEIKNALGLKWGIRTDTSSAIITSLKMQSMQK